MSKCDVTVRLDGNQPNYVIGDTITGTVHIQVNKECQCDKLTVAPMWKTHGRGNRAQGGPADEITVFQGKWSPGSYEYPFEFTLPAGPLTYHGHYLNVDWSIHARADIPWAIDPKGDGEFVLERGGYEGELSVGDADVPGAAQITIGDGSTSGVALGCVFLFLSPFLIFGVGAMIGGITKLTKGEMDGIPLLLFGFVFSIIPCGIILAVFWRKFAERKLGKVDVTVEPTSARPGDPIWCAVSFSPTKDVKVASVTATVVGTETVVSGSGTNATTHTHQLYEHKVELLSQRHISAGKNVSLDCEVMIPEDAAPTFMAHSNRLHWAVNVHVDIPKWPDWSGSESVQVG